MFDHSNQPVVTVTVDKLSLVRDVPDNLRAFYKAQFLSLKEEFPQVFVNGGSRAGYRVNIRGTLPGPTTVLLQCDPHNASLPFIRLEMNPSKVTPEDGSPLPKYFEFMFDHGFPEFASKAKVTRLDIAIDVEGRRPADMVCGTVKSAASVSYAGSSGDPETLYLGRLRGTPFAIYDKGLQSKLSGARTRIEKRTKPGCFLPHVSDAKNPLLDLRVYEVSTFVDALALPNSESNLVCALAQAKGIRGALASCGTSLSSILKSRIEAASQTPWWDPHHFWGLVPEYLIGCGLLGSKVGNSINKPTAPSSPFPVG